MIKPFITRDSFTAYLEPTEMGWFIHLHVYEWNKTVRKELLEDRDKLLSLVSPNPLYCITDPTERNGPADVEKHYKFITQTMGFTFERYVTHKDGHTLFLYSSPALTGAGDNPIDE